MKALQIIVIASLLTVTTVVIWRQWPNDRDAAPVAAGHDDMSHADGDAAFATGPNGGRLLEQEDFALEVTIFESGIPAEFHLYPYLDGEPLPPDEIDVSIELARLGGKVDRFTFEPEAGYLHSLETVVEPHSFDVSVTARRGSREYAWAYDSHEGRTQIPRRIADAQGIVAEPAGPTAITEFVELVGTVQTDPGRVSQVRVRFPGVVTRVDRTVGDFVERGEPLGEIETNESLRRVEITAPINGLVVDRSLQIGQATGDSPLFVIADLSEVWVQLDVFGSDLPSVAIAQPVEITTLDGRVMRDVIDWVSPLVAHGSQSVQARVRLPNPENRLRPGQFVRGRVRVAAYEVPLAVKRSGLQTFREFDVVYARVGDVYEVRMLELGRRDAEHVEILSGLEPGEVYVAGNSYLVKADIEKSGATHDH